MSKKKKKEKKKKSHDIDEDAEQIPEYSLDSALHSAKSTETTLQTLLKGVSEGQGFVKLQKEGDVKITPQLSHESHSKIAEAYVLEDIPLVQRAKDEKEEKTKLVTEDSEISEPVAPKDQLDVSSSSQVKPTPSSVITEPLVTKQKNIYLKLTEFFEGLLSSYNDNYDRWEMSISNILGILRKMRKITKKNTEDMVGSISRIYEKIQANLEQFKIKRDEIERVAEVDIESMSGEFKRVLGMLELQVKEYQLKRVADEFIHEWRHLE